MPQVIEAPDAIQEEQWYQDEEKTAPQSPLVVPRRERTRVFAFVRSAVETLINRHLRPQPYVTHTMQRFELPIERVAREHPFLYIKAMSG